MAATVSGNSRTLLAVLAHPDDESFGMGGTLAYYARRGVAVHLVCATMGEAGTVSENYLQGYESIAARRAAELQCAASNLGLAGVHLLGYRDSGMPGTPDNQHPQALINAPLDEVADKIAGYIHQLRPQVVLTFDPIGGYKHPDHIAIHKATIQAFELARKTEPASSPDKLYFHVIPKGLLKLAVRLLPLFGIDPRHVGLNKDIDLTSLVEDGDFPVHAVINYRKALESKDAASMCHESQLAGASLRRGPMRWAQTLFWQKDYFMRAYPPVQNGLREADLFDGI